MKKNLVKNVLIIFFFQLSEVLNDQKLFNSKLKFYLNLAYLSCNFDSYRLYNHPRSLGFTVKFMQNCKMIIKIDEKDNSKKLNTINLNFINNFLLKLYL